MAHNPMEGRFVRSPICSPRISNPQITALTRGGRHSPLTGSPLKGGPLRHPGSPSLSTSSPRPMLERVEQLQSCMESMKEVLAEAIKTHGGVQDPWDEETVQLLSSVR